MKALVKIAWGLVLFATIGYIAAVGLTLALNACEAQAQTIGVDAASVHIPGSGDQNNSNVGAYVALGHIGFGAYRNTIHRTTDWVGYFQPLGQFDLIGGAASGYQKRTAIGQWAWTNRGNNGPVATYQYIPGRTVGFSDGWLTPFVAASWRVPVSLAGVRPRITVLPGFRGASSTVVHLSVEKDL